MNDKPMNDKPRRNLATITRKVSRQVHVYEYIKVDSKPGELEYMQLCNVSNSEGPYKRVELLNMHVMSASMLLYACQAAM